MKKLVFIGLLCLSTWAKAQVLDTICLHGNPSHLAVDFHVGSTYWWNVPNGVILTGLGTHEVFVEWTLPGLHLVETAELNANGCWSDTARAYVFLSQPDQALINGPVNVCRGENVSLYAGSGTELLWNGQIKQSALNFTAQTDTTVYLVAYNGVCDNDTIWHTVHVVDPPEALYTMSTDSVHRMEWVDFVYTGPPATTISWYIDGELKHQGTQFSYQFTEIGSATMDLVVENESCYDQISRTFILEDELQIAIPNAFTPDGDGMNDVFYFKADGILAFNAQIYNRWGTLLYAWNDAQENGWNGMFQGQVAPADVYVYRIVIRDFHGYEHVYDGQITLVR